MLTQFATVLIFLLVGAGFILVSLLIGKLIRPNNPNAVKNSPYECGEPVVGSGWLNYNLRFYIIALVFVVFDVEIAFIYPVAVVFKDWIANGNAILALVELLVFAGILFMALIYIWAKGDMEWFRDFTKGGQAPIKGFEKPLESAEAKGFSSGDVE